MDPSQSSGAAESAAQTEPPSTPDEGTSVPANGAPLNGTRFEAPEPSGAIQLYAVDGSVEAKAADDADDRSNSFISRIGRWAGFGSGTQNGEGESPADEASQLPAATPVERAMILNVVRMRDLRVDDVMTPRADIVAVSEEDDLDRVVAAFQEGGFSRLPVYRETLDDPIGFIHLKDVALGFGFGCSPDVRFAVNEHLREALFVPESMRATQLLQQMQLRRVHMALVIDEFGGVEGLVTIEDLVEQIVGDIEDEHDEATMLEWRSEGPGVFNVDARAEIASFEEAIGLRLRAEDWEEEADTLGGLVFMLASRVPTRGEVIAHPDGHEFQVIDADPRRIKRIRVVLAGATAPQRTAAE